MHTPAYARVPIQVRTADNKLRVCAARINQPSQFGPGGGIHDVPTRITLIQLDSFDRDHKFAGSSVYDIMVEILTH